MEDYDNRINFEDLFSHSKSQAKRVKNLARSVKLSSQQANMQSEKVKSITEKVAISLQSDLKNIQDSSSNQIVSKLNILLPNSSTENQQHTSHKKFTKDFGDLKKQSSSNFENGVGLPTLPTTGLSEKSDENSDSESEFYPDCSSVESFTSSFSRGSLGEGRRSLVFDRLHSSDDLLFDDEDVLQLSDDDEFDALAKTRREGAVVECKVKYENFSTGSASDTELEEQRVLLDYYSGTRHPIPAAGNDKPGPSRNITNLPNIVKQETSSECVKAPALRRVKSMILDNDLEDGVQVGRRMFVLQQKRQSDGQSAHLSPLLSDHDVTLKKCNSQVTSSVHYSLKRSRSNISFNTTGYYQRSSIGAKPPLDGNGTIAEEEEID